MKNRAAKSRVAMELKQISRKAETKINGLDVVP
jgi:hypothetical protein